MSDHRHADALTDEAFDRDLMRALAVDPSPEFLARVRTRIANEPEPGMWRIDRRGSLRPWRVAAAVVAAVVVDPIEPRRRARDHLDAARHARSGAQPASILRGVRRQADPRRSEQVTHRFAQ